MAVSFESGPTGIPDDSNPGFDTGGYPLSSGSFTNTAPAFISNTPTTPLTINGSTVTGAFGSGAGAGNTGFFGGGGTSLVTPPTTTTPTPTPSGDGLVNAYTGVMPTYDDPGSFSAPTLPNVPAFSAPTITDALNDPGYSFGLNQGEQALQNSAAAGGVLNTGNTLKNILEFGNNYATSKYNDLFNRDLSAYNTNYQTQYVAPYQAAYQNAIDTYNSKANNASATNAFNWNEYLQGYKQYVDRINNTVNTNAATS